MAEIEKVIKQLELLSTHNVAPNIMKEAIQTIRELQSQIPKWHLVDDWDFPNDSREVLCTDIYGDYFVGWYANKSWTDGEFANINVEAWMELPKFEEVK